MQLTRKQKEEQVKKLEESLKKIKSAVFVDYQKVKVLDITKLRKSLRSKNIEFKTVKKTLTNLALKKANIAVDTSKFPGPIATILGYADEAETVKEVVTFSKANPTFKILGGVLENKFIDAEMVSSLAKLPSKQEMLGKVVGTIAAPISGFATVLNGNIRNLVYALNAISKQKTN